MSTTRYQRQPLQIYQDPISLDQIPMPRTQSIPPKSSSPLRPIKNASSRRNIVFNPPVCATGYGSPLKSAQQTSSSPLRAPYGSKLNIVSMPPREGLNNLTDSMRKKEPLLSKFRTGPQKVLFPTSTTAHLAGKENFHPALAPAPMTAPYDSQSLPNFALNTIHGQKSQNKRVLMEAAPIEGSKPAKKHKAESVLPQSATDQFPILSDDGQKPPHSYAMLIGMAILRAPNRRLTLAQIYKWISDTYSYYSAADAGWQNSIRHNLSLNKAFVKRERPKDDPGKGNYWSIEPGKEKQFFKSKQGNNSKGANENVPVLSTTLSPPDAREPLPSSFKTSTPAPQDLPTATASFIPSNESAVAAGADISSDATIPMSDALVLEEVEEDDFMARHSHYPPIPSSPPPMMRSSPPVSRQVHIRQNTPPPVPRFPTSSRTRSHKRNFASMDDSGYYSSLNSSALRGPHADRRLTSEADRPRIKRGRAEEEIARLRGSSYDSPTKTRNFMTQPAFAPASSSPIRRDQNYDSLQMLPPLTPAVKLKAPIRPPPSVSPNTNLRLHRDSIRQLVGSPERGMTCLDDNLPWSPAFKLDPHLNDATYIDFSTDIDIFADTDSNLLSVPGAGSPLKNPTRRSRLSNNRPSSILGDVSNMSFNKNVTSTPMLKFSPSPAPPAFESPSKGYDPVSPVKFNSPSLNFNAFDLPQEDFYGAEFLTDEVAEFSGMDIMQGFQKIGAGNLSNGHTPKSSSQRHSLTRNSFTTRF